MGISRYLDTVADEEVNAEQYTGFSNSIGYNGVLIYLNNTDWIVIKDNGYVTAYTNEDFVARFVAV